MLKPEHLGLPQFPNYRPVQLSAISKILDSKKTSFILNAPTGVGKSLIGISIAKLKNEKAVYLVGTKQLQEQLLADFPDIIGLIKGRENFPCTKLQKMFPSVTALDCTHTRDSPCSSLPFCEYLEHKRAALSKQIVCTNYPFFLSEANYIGELSHMPLIIGDECDCIDDELLSFVQLTITPRQIAQLNMDPPKFKTKLEAWVDWAKGALNTINQQVSLLEEGSNWDTDDIPTVRKLLHLRRLRGKVDQFLREVDDSWVWYPEAMSDGKESWVFKPTWVSKYAHGYLWRHGEKHLLMSATVIGHRSMAKDISLPEYDYLEMDSPFPVSHRPIFYTPTTDVTFKNKQESYPKLALEIKAIMAQHHSYHILVHCVSYSLRDYLWEHLPPDRLMKHDTKNRNQVLEEFKKTSSPKVLLSPSMERGVSLNDDSARVVVVAKVPFLSLADPQVSKRAHTGAAGRLWYTRKAVESLIQSTGRHVRTEDDWGLSYILDTQFGKILENHRELFFKWWLDGLKEGEKFLVGRKGG